MKKFKIQYSRFNIPNSKSRAFTLIEIILVIALMMILLVAALQTIIGSTAQFAFQNTNIKVLDLLQQARSLAISGKAQLDYTDFDQDGCTDAVVSQGKCFDKNPPQGQGFATPAHYGVHFHLATEAADPTTMTLFVDNHELAQNPTFREKEFLLPNTTTPLVDYQHGADILIEQYVLPKNTDLIFLNAQGNPTQTSGDFTIFYSPVFADVSFKPDLAASQNSLFQFAISQQDPNSAARKKCYSLHALSGIAEPYTCP